MRISVVADVHGNYDALARVAEQADRLIILGDLLDYVDYYDPTRGILGEMFTQDAVLHFTQLRVRGAFAELYAFNASLWSSLADPIGELSGMVQRRYQRVIDVIGSDTLVTLGNVDVADEWARVASGTLRYRDGDVVEIAGLRFGFVAGGVSRRRPRVDGHSPWHPFVRSVDDYQSAVDSLGPVDVLCTHIPPDIAALRYDTVPARLEMAGPGLTQYIDRQRPLLSLFGHVHQPLATRVRRGVTECLNVGHFQRAEQPLILDTDRLAHAIDLPAAVPGR